MMVETATEAIWIDLITNLGGPWGGGGTHLFSEKKEKMEHIEAFKLMEGVPDAWQLP